ncbi:MAG: KTSC domain-containing protein [Sphingomicrobium sp.]|nr:KTSC domain-containing protein [Sphingomonadales bacterium]
MNIRNIRATGGGVRRRATVRLAGESLRRKRVGRVSRRAVTGVRANMTASTLIARASYWPDEQALELSFTSGRRYLYLGVPAKVADAFAAAESKGEYFNRSIKGRFACHELARSRAA